MESRRHIENRISLFEDLQIPGKPTHTIVFGEVIIEDEKLVNKEYRGKPLKRWKAIVI